MNTNILSSTGRGLGLPTRNVSAEDGKSNKLGILSNKKKVRPINRFRYHIGFHRNRADDNERTSCNRDYGLLRANTASTPFPRKLKAIDEVALSAKLEATKVELSGSSSTSLKPSIKEHFAEPAKAPHPPYLTFEMRRKMFDEAEFTICKGRKMSDVFHPTQVTDRNDISQPKEDGMKTPYTYFTELKAFCRDNNIKLSEGFDR
ncbi:uncharacterized protein LOC108044190 [Drosophila rhopaloa]|uniref:Uncharacterized protein LOC108044190 n=1 Tax=Drosophila rhopaloa TaxID=1041015 RepID=A0A6P4EK53_DRORH|nr:uncharacterized protein LOC108044190 [Drosophila rhopaloa]